MEALKFPCDEAVASLWLGRRSGVLSVITIAAALFLLGALLLVTWNVGQMLEGWAGAGEMSVYLRDDASPGNRAAVDQLLADSNPVAGREYMSKTDALVKFRSDFAYLVASPATFQTIRFPPRSRSACSPGPRTRQPSRVWPCASPKAAVWPTFATTGCGLNG